MARWWIPYIQKGSARRGLDPKAVLAIAQHEGLSGAVGDGGTSYGPFQLHRGGALPQGKGRQWAESPAGIDYALNQINSVAHGMRGRRAVANIARRFERPSDPEGEINDAMRYYGRVGGGGGAPPMMQPGMFNMPQAPALGRMPAKVNLGLALGKLMASSNNPFDFGGIMKGLPRMGPLPQMRMPAMRMPSYSGGGGEISGMGTYPLGRRGKQIGSPYQGTHNLGNWESDKAVDIAVPRGTPVRAVANGVIGSQIGALNSRDPHMLGLRVHLQYGGDEAYYAHLSRLTVHAGQRVRKGQIIGYSGAANGVNHLHFATKKADPRRLTR